MKGSINIIIMSLALAGGVVFTSYGQSATPLIKGKQKAQKRKIEKGIRSGELTFREVRGLKREQRQIRSMKRTFKVDGIVTRKERALVLRKQQVADVHIYRQKHDGQSRN